MYKHCRSVLMQVILSICGILFSIVLSEFMLLCCVPPAFSIVSFCLHSSLNPVCTLPLYASLKWDLMKRQMSDFSRIIHSQAQRLKFKKESNCNWMEMEFKYGWFPTHCITTYNFFLILPYGEVHMYLVAGGFQILNLDLCQPTVRWYYLSNVG